jgi:hypothetical protein
MRIGRHLPLDRVELSELMAQPACSRTGRIDPVPVVLGTPDERLLCAATFTLAEAKI